MNEIREYVISKTCAPELLVAVPPEPSMKPVTDFDPSKVSPIFVFVYRYERQVSEKEHYYVFVGGRIR